MLNRLWLGFFLTAAVAALAQWLVGGNAGVFAAIVGSLFDMAKLSVEVMILLFGTLTLWLGFLRIAERAGLVDLLARALGPLFVRLMPEVPRGHPAIGLITLNFAANVLGLDNAATPIGLRAMRELQTLNPSADTASNAQILFLVLNASSLTLLPVSIFMYRAQQGAHDPTLVFVPILLATSASTLVGLLSVAFVQKLRLRDPLLLVFLLAVATILSAFIALLLQVPASALAPLSSLLGNLTLFAIVLGFLVAGAWRKVPVYESFVDALPTALVKPFSGSAARALLIETMKAHGTDSFAALLAATVQGSTETTFYVLAVYFGSVGIQRARHAVGCALLADCAGVCAAVAVCYWFFG